MSILRILYMQMPESAPFLFPDISRQSYVLMLSRLFQDDAKVRIICNICKFLLGYPIYNMGRTDIFLIKKHWSKIRIYPWNMSAGSTRVQEITEVVFIS